MEEKLTLWQKFVAEQKALAEKNGLEPVTTSISLQQQAFEKWCEEKEKEAGRSEK